MLSCNACSITDRGAPSPPDFVDIPCWSLTNLMQTDGKLLTANEEDMRRSSDRVKTKLPSDGPGEFTGPAVKSFNACNSKQKRIVCYHKLFRFLYGIGITGVRIALPSCCVLRIQNEYRDPLHPACAEEGFVQDSFDDGLINP